MASKATLRHSSLQGIIPSLQAAANDLYESAPWKYVPGPWLMLVSVKIGESRTIERFVCILGASDKARRGLAIYDSISDYQMRPPLPKALAFMFKDGKKNVPTIMKTNGLSPIDPSFEDIEFLEGAIRSIGNFVLEAANMGGGGVNPSPTPRSPEEILMSLSGTSPDDLEAYPCLQRAATFRGEIEVRVQVVPTDTAYFHLETRGARIRAKDEDITPLSASINQCIVCSKTESDCRSTSGHGLRKCANCNSKNERYCGRECQKADCIQSYLTNYLDLYSPLSRILALSSGSRHKITCQTTRNQST